MAETPHPDAVFASAKVLRELADTFGTPLLVYDRKTMERRTAEIYKAFSWNPGFRQYFPVREADNPALLRVLLEAGSGLLCSNAAQLYLAALAGAGSEDLLFMAGFPRETDWEAARQSGATVVLDSPEQLQRLRAESYGKGPLGLRVQAEALGMGTSGGLGRFGMERSPLLDTARHAARWGFSSLGLYMQSANNTCTPGYYAAQARLLVELAGSLEEKTGLPVAWCNLGGGLAWEREADNMLAREARLLRASMESTGRCFHTSLGRYLMAPSGILLTQVWGVKHLKKPVVGLDASTAELPRATLSGMRHHVSVLGDQGTGKRIGQILSGSITERIDVFGQMRLLPPVSVGDLLVFHDTGVYSRSMASNYNGALRCPEVLLDRNGPRLIRRRESREQWLSTLCL